jgi:RNA polymerase-associated protein LEO1
LDQRPFDRDTFEAADEDELVEGPEGQKMKPLPPETIMRWRYTTDKYGQQKRESNARFVRWSNGTVQLFLGGNEEVLDVDMQNITKENYHIFAKQKGSIKAHGRLDNKLFFTPSTLHSKSHQKLTMHLVKQSQQKARKVKLVSISTVDPEIEKRNKEALEQERIKQNQRKKEMNKSYGLTSNMLEEGEFDDDGSDVDEKRILDAKHSSSDPVRKRNREATTVVKRRSGGGGGGRDRRSKENLDDFIDDDSDGEGSDVNIDDWEMGGGGRGSDDDAESRKRRRSSSSSSSSRRKSGGGRSDSDSD